MGPGLVILFWLILAGIFGAFWLTSLVLFLIGWRKKKPWLKWLGLVPLAGLTRIASLGMCFFAVVTLRAITPRYVFADTFGQKPSTDVTNIKSKVWSFADEADVHLQFQASTETFRRLLPKDLRRVTLEEYNSQMPIISGHTWPSWWRPVGESTTEIYLLNTGFGKGKKFASETTLMTYDANTRVVQYFYIGID